MAKALMRYPYDIKLPDELVELGSGPLKVPSSRHVERKLQTINSRSAPFNPALPRTSREGYPFGVWKGQLMLELSSRVHDLSEGQEALLAEDCKIALWAAVEESIQNIVYKIRQELEKANSGKSERKKAKLWSLRTFFLAVSDGAEIIKRAVNHYFLDDEKFVPQLVAEWQFLSASMKPLYALIHPDPYQGWPAAVQISASAYISNKSPKEFVREIESYLKENQNHEGPTPAAPTLSLSSRLELNTRQKRIYGFV
ncbi:hypothetical protein JCM16303_003797 [Sporobolomyces ruberrimus]